MNTLTPTRRSFLKSAGAGTGAVLGLGALPFGLPHVSAEDAAVDPSMVRFRPEIEPLVRLIEDTSRDRLLEEIGQRIRQGTPYRDVLAALLLAGVRNVQPRPVGFKFHAVLVVNAAHLASQNSPDADRWLPIFWALDNFKNSQARDVAEGDWTMAPVRENLVPSAESAAREFESAMSNWDEERADAAVAGLARTAGVQEIFNLFCRFGSRDFRDIGHKAIYVANSWRTLQTIGWSHAEPVLRSLAYALLMHNGGNPAQRDDTADQDGRRNRERLHRFRPGWQGGQPDPAAAADLLDTLRHGSPDDAAEKVIERLNRGADPAGLWGSLYQGASEMMMRKPGIVALHACTTVNALGYAHRTVSDDETRRYLLLQCASFLPRFRSAAGEGADRGPGIDDLEAASAPAGPEGLTEIFTDLGGDRALAARKTLGWLQAGGSTAELMAAAQRLIYLKGTDAHDYKFSAAILEDQALLPPAHRARYLASAMVWLKAATASDSPLVSRTRAALGI